MLTHDEVKSLLLNLESSRIERTVATPKSKPDKFGEAICAFANDYGNTGQPGYLVVGAEDKTGHITGMEITDSLLQQLAAWRDDGRILPRPSINVEKIDFPEGSVAVIEVFPSDMPPVKYRGRTWIRSGPRKSLATEQEEVRLTERRTANVRTFDLSPCRGFDTTQIDLKLFERDYLNAAVAPEIIEANNRDVFLQMASLGLWDTQNQCATHAGVLLLGKNPRLFLPGCYLQYVRYEGNELASEVLDERQFEGDLISLLYQLDTFLKTLFPSKPLAVSPLQGKNVSPYPMGAIRELLMNAVMHRDYQSNAPIRFYWFQDRIEIQNPGGLYGEARGNFPDQNAYRNPKIAEVMKNLGYVERFGRGIAVVQSKMKENGNPPAEFLTTEPNYFLAIAKEAKQ